MVCLVCQDFTRGSVCARCRLTLRPAPDRLLPQGLRLIAAFEHDGPAKKLVHHLKYRSMTGFAELTAELLAERLPALPLVPVPRSLSRRLRYGVDGAQEIALALARRLGVPVVDVLAAPVHSPRRAGRDHGRAPVYRLRRDPPPRLLIVDDVVTTGATIMSVADSLGLHRVHAVVAANVVTQPSNVGGRVTSPSQDGPSWQQF